MPGSDLTNDEWQPRWRGVRRGEDVLMVFPMPDDFDLSGAWRQAPVESPDERIARMVRQRLYDDPWTCLRRVRVQVQNRVVILEGELESARARWVAVFHAWQTPGVHDVCDMLTEPGGRPAEPW